MAGDDVVRLVDIKYTTTGAEQAEAANKRVSTSLGDVGVQADKTTRANLSVERSFDSLQKKYDVVYRATQQQTAEQTKLDNARKQGLVSDERYAFLQGQIAQNYQQTVSGAGKAGAATAGLAQNVGLARHELQNLSRQAQDVVVSLAGGQGLGTVALQQGSQIFDVFSSSTGTVKGFFNQVVEGAGKILTPARLATAGILGLGAAALYVGYQWSEAQDKVNQSLIGIGARTGTTAADINRFAKENSSATGLSVAAARDVAIEFTKTGNITVSTLKGVGDAVHGYSVLTGKDATTATKEFAGLLGGDLVEAAKKLDQTYGFLNASTLDSIRNFQSQGDRAKAMQVILDGIANDNTKANESVGFLTKSYTLLANTLSVVKNGFGEVETAQQRLDRLRATQERTGSVVPDGAITPGGYLNTRAAFGGPANKQIAASEKEVSDAAADVTAKRLNAISSGADLIVHSVLPAIDALQKFDEAIKLVEASQNTPGAKTPGMSDQALTVLKYQRDLTQDSLDTTVRQAQVVTGLKAAWGGVSAETAVALNHLQGQLGVAQSVTGQEQMRAQYVATVNDLLAQGKSEYEAQAIAAAQIETAHAAATSNVLKQVDALRDSTDMIRAQASGTEAATAAAIAYKNAIKEGASAAAAAALSAETMANYTARAAAAAAQQAANDEMRENAKYGAIYDSRGNLVGIKNAWGSDWNDGKQYTSSYDPLGAVSGPLQLYNNIGPTAQGISNTANQAYQNGGIDAAITALKGVKAFGGIPLSGGGMYGDVAAVPLDYNALFSQADALYALKNGGTSDKNTQVSNLQAELAWIQSLPESLVRDQKILDLKKSIQDLQGSVDANTDALNQVALNPLYNGRDALRVGYYKAASGYDGVVTGGIPGVDSVPIRILAQRGERVQVHPVGWQDNQPGYANGNSPRVQQTIINQTNNFSGGGGSKDARLNELQLAQGFGRIAAAQGGRR